MSRMSMRAFLAASKRQLQQTIREQSHASFVIGNESADLDSITCALLYGYIVSSKTQARTSGRYVIPITNIPAADLDLRPELKVLLKHADIKPSELITLDDLGESPLPVANTEWALVDHNVLQGNLGQIYRGRVVGVIDHHDDEKAVPQDAQPRTIQKTGSCISLVVNHLRDTWQQLSDSASTVGAAHPQNNERLIDDFAYTSTWDAQVAKLALGAILIDTVNLKAEQKTTDHDRKAVRFLEAKINISRKYGKDYSRDIFFNEINDASHNLDELCLKDVLRKDYKEWKEGDLTLGISSVVKDMQWLSGKDPDFIGAAKSFAQSRKLQLFSIMTAVNEGDFHRQLLLIALSKEAKSIADKFVKMFSAELKLEDAEKSPISQDPELPFQQYWTQKNLEASRKRVAPMLREAMAA